MKTLNEIEKLDLILTKHKITHTTKTEAFWNGTTINVKRKQFSITFAQHDGTHQSLEMLIWDSLGNFTSLKPQVLFTSDLDTIIKVIRLFD
jgi:hypothetical protein